MTNTVNRVLFGAVATLLAATAAHAADISDALRLRKEGREILDKARGGGGDEIAGSKRAVAKFEEAVAILERFPEGSREAELMQDLNSLIFWTRRTTPMDLRHLSSTPAAPAPNPAKKANPAEAANALAGAEAYARKNPDDPMVVAARFFEVADKYGNVHTIAFKAISRAQHFQRLAAEREALRKLEAKYNALPRDEKLAVDGDKANAAGDYDKAISSYRQAISVKETPERNRKLGHACFNRAQQYREEYSKAYLQIYKEYRRAQARRDKKAILEASRKSHQINSISGKAIALYTETEDIFNKTWTAAQRFDIDAELHMALCNIIRPKPYNQDRAKKILKRILRTYYGKLKTNEERTLYAVAQTYAGPEVTQAIMRQIAGHANVTGGGESKKMSDADLTAAIKELSASLEKNQKQVKRKQMVGVLDRNLRELVESQKKRLQELKDEAAERGLNH